MTLENTNFTGHFLIAMPNLTDPYFAKSVTLFARTIKMVQWALSSIALPT